MRIEDDPEYRSHAVFASLERYVGFYGLLSDSIMRFLTPGTGALVNIDSYLYGSMGGTLSSIRLILAEGRVNDGVRLAAEVLDSITLSLYVGLYLTGRWDERSAKVAEVRGWLRGEMRLPRYEVMKDSVVRAKQLAPIIGMLLGRDDRYKGIRDRSNGHVHYNDFQHVLLNQDTYIDRRRVLDRFARDLTDLFVLHLACAFHMNGHYMMASDYVDYLDCGLAPEVDSQYWVAPFVQEIFDEVLCPMRPDVCQAIKGRTSMQLD